MEKLFHFMTTILVLFTGACNFTHAEAISSEELRVKAEIDSWTEKWKSPKENLHDYSASVLNDIRSIPQMWKRDEYFDRFVEVVLASSFEDGPKFPLEDWERRPIDIGEEDPRISLRWKHQAIVLTGEMLYREQSRLLVPMKQRIALVLRFADKMEKERQRLNAIEVGDVGSRLVDVLERDVWDYLQGDPSEEKQQVKVQFKKGVGHCVRPPSKIFEDRAKFKKQRSAAIDARVREYIRTIYDRKP